MTQCWWIQSSVVKSVPFSDNLCDLQTFFCSLFVEWRPNMPAPRTPSYASFWPSENALVLQYDDASLLPDHTWLRYHCFQMWWSPFTGSKCPVRNCDDVLVGAAVSLTKFWITKAWYCVCKCLHYDDLGFIIIIIKSNVTSRNELTWQALSPGS